MQFPDRGRKQLFQREKNEKTLIEKCSSPTGDGNKYTNYNRSCAFIEKCSSPTGDGNTVTGLTADSGWVIEKCSSPTGDGNCRYGI